VEKSEVETVIVINRADMDDGFFVVESTDKRAWEHVLKRLEGYEVELVGTMRVRVPAKLIARLVTFWSK